MRFRVVSSAFAIVAVGAAVAVSGPFHHHHLFHHHQPVGPSVRNQSVEAQGLGFGPILQWVVRGALDQFLPNLPDLPDFPNFPNRPNQPPKAAEPLALPATFQKLDRIQTNVDSIEDILKQIRDNSPIKEELKKIAATAPAVAPKVGIPPIVNNPNAIVDAKKQAGM